MKTHSRARCSMWRIRWVGVVGLAIAGCSDHMMNHGAMNAPEVIELPPWEGAFEGAVAPDLDPADDDVEVRTEANEAEVEIAQGHRVRLWTYNGLLPGPRIEAREGNTVRIRFKNSLPEATTVHWHGLIPSRIHVLAKPSGATCKLACSYCFFLDKELLYPVSNFRMSDEVLETYLKANLKTRKLLPDGSYSWVKPEQGDKPLNPQTWLIERRTKSKPE